MNHLCTAQTAIVPNWTGVTLTRARVVPFHGEVVNVVTSKQAEKQVESIEILFWGPQLEGLITGPPLDIVIIIIIIIIVVVVVVVVAAVAVVVIIKNKKKLNSNILSLL